MHPLLAADPIRFKTRGRCHQPDAPLSNGRHFTAKPAARSKTVPSINGSPCLVRLPGKLSTAARRIGLQCSLMLWQLKHGRSPEHIMVAASALLLSVPAAMAVPGFCSVRAPHGPTRTPTASIEPVLFQRHMAGPRAISNWHKRYVFASSDFTVRHWWCVDSVK
jgi:hypothetical protein